MDQSAYDAINSDVLSATLRAFAIRGFSGDLEFHHERRQVIRRVTEVHHVTEPVYSDVLGDLAPHWPRIENWIRMPGTILQVSFHAGKITRVRHTDQTEKV